MDKHTHVYLLTYLPRTHTGRDLIVNGEKLDKVVPQWRDMLPVFKQVSADHVHWAYRAVWRYITASSWNNFWKSCTIFDIFARWQFMHTYRSIWHWTLSVVKLGIQVGRTMCWQREVNGIGSNWRWQRTHRHSFLQQGTQFFSAITQHI